MNSYMHDPDAAITPYLLKSRTLFLVGWMGYDLGKGTLDIGLKNAVMSALCGNNGYTSIDGDLNSLKWMPTRAYPFKVVTCLEVLEHLQNPLLFLNRLKEFIAPDGILYLTTPRATFRFLTMSFHFHEFTRRDLLNLLDMAGWEVLEIGTTKSGYPWWLPFRMPGFRPLCRALFQKSFAVKAKIREC